MYRRSERPNPLLKHVEEYRKSSKPLLKLEHDEVRRLAQLQAEAIVSHPDIHWELKELIQRTKPL